VKDVIFSHHLKEERRFLAPENFANFPKECSFWGEKSIILRNLADSKRLGSFISFVSWGES